MSIEVKHLSYCYDPDTTYSKMALKDISFTIERGEMVGLIGHTGSGKSTLIQHLNGLVKPTSGEVWCDGENIFDGKCDLRKIRQKVGLVFQYPEYQLFETTVKKDVEFGPRNMKLPEDEIKRRTEQALSVVGMGKETYKMSPFELSGGQKRRTAIAGVLAMGPEYLILDEPTAGLDPKGREGILKQIRALRDEMGIAVVLVSHSMEDMARYVDRLIVLNEGELVYDASPRTVFREPERLEEIGLGVPQVTELGKKLKERGFDMPDAVLNVQEMKDLLVRELQGSEKKGAGRA